MKTFKIFSTAALALMMAACSSEDTALNNSPQQGRKVHFTATIAAPGGNAGTRTEYTEDTENKKITVAWKVDDEIALVHDKVMDVVKVKTVNADGSATIDGTITSATDEATVQLVYPAARVSAVNSDGNPEFDEAVSGKLLTQDGTLTYIQNNIDFREGEGQLSVNGTEVTLNAAVDMVSSIAIWKLTLQDNAATSAALAATQVKIKSGENELASTATLTQATSTVYLALPCDSYDELTIEATVGSDTYAYTKEEGVTFDSKYYQSKVTMAPAATDLSKLTGDYTAKNGETLTGTLAGKTQPYKISIAKGATVTLDGVTINGEDDYECEWAGITCEGDATIILKDETTNTVTGFFSTYPGIQAGPKGTTLTIKGTGSLTASCSNAAGGGGAGIGGNSGGSCGSIVIEGGSIRANGSYGAGIGSGSGSEASCGAITISGGTVTATGGYCGAGIGSGSCGNCGNISISGGTVTATGGAYGAGIGSGVGDVQSSTDKCGDILISGGTVSATGGQWAAGIGSGCDGSCGSIEITTDVTQVTATKGDGATYSIGAGNSGSCTSVTIGCTLNNDGNPVGGTPGAISTSLYTYPAPASLITNPAVGQVIGINGKNYANAAAATADGTTAVAVIAFVGSETGVAGYTHGLAIALADEGTMNWSTAMSTCGAKTAITGAMWCLPSQDQWKQMFKANGGNEGSYNDLNTTITTPEGTALQGDAGYWSSSELNPGVRAYFVYLDSGVAGWLNGSEGDNALVRACLAF